MGFDLTGFVVFNPRALWLYELMVPGGSKFGLSLPDEPNDRNLPVGSWLPAPWRLAQDVQIVEDFFAPEPIEAWAAQLGLPLPLPADAEHGGWSQASKRRPARVISAGLAADGYRPLVALKL